MARQNHGPLSRAKGKLGGVVYQQYEGMQISREYQPVVKNPQTTSQVNNRAKFKLASQTVAQLKEIINVRLAPLSIYTRMKRAMAVNALFSRIDMSTPNEPQLTIDDIVDALNAKNVSSLAAPLVEASVGGAASTITATNGDIVTYVQVSFNNDGSIAAHQTETYTSTGTRKEVPAPSTHKGILLAVAARATTENGRAFISNIAANVAVTKIINAISRSVIAGDLEITNLAGVSIAS